MEANALSTIQIVEASTVLRFETILDRSSPSINISETRQIRHPFLVTDLGDQSYLLLERTLDFVALADSGLAHLPVQVCDPKDLTFSEARLGLSGFNAVDLHRFVARHPEQTALNTFRDSAEKCPVGFIELVFEFTPEEKYRLFLRHSSRSGCPPPLEYLFAAITKNGRYVTITDRRISGLSGGTLTSSFSGFLKLGPFSLFDLRTAARTDRLFPGHLVNLQASQRVLNIDFPTEVLASDIPVNEKQLFLKDLIALRQQSRRTSFYQGSIYLLNI